jgi:hypothetical protein
VLLVSGAGAGGSAEVALALPPGLRLAATPGGKLDVRVQLLDVAAAWHAPGAVARQARAAGAGVTVQLLPAASPAAGFAARASALALLHVLLPDSAGPLLARLAAPVVAADAARLAAGALPTRARAALARRLRSGGAPGAAARRALEAGGGAAGAALHAARALAGPAAALAAAGFLWSLLHPESLAVARAAVALFAMSCEYEQLGRAVSRGAVPRGPAAEAAWRRLHKRAARRLAPHIGDLPAAPPLAPLLALAARAQVVAGAVARGEPGAGGGCAVAGGFARGDCWWQGSSGGGSSGGEAVAPGPRLLVSASLAPAAPRGPGSTAPLTREQLRELFCGPEAAPSASGSSSDSSSAEQALLASPSADVLAPIAEPNTRAPAPAGSAVAAAAAVVLLAPRSEGGSYDGGSVDAILEIAGGSAGTSKAGSVAGDRGWAGGEDALASHPVSVAGDVGGGPASPSSSSSSSSGGSPNSSSGGSPSSSPSSSSGVSAGIICAAATRRAPPAASAPASAAGARGWGEWCASWWGGGGGGNATSSGGPGAPGLAALLEAGPDCPDCPADPMAFLERLPLYGQADHASAAAAAEMAAAAAGAAPALPPRPPQCAPAPTRWAAGAADAAGLAARAAQLGLIFAPFLWVGLPLLAAAHAVAVRGDALAAQRAAAAAAVPAGSGGERESSSNGDGGADAAAAAAAQGLWAWAAAAAARAAAALAAAGADAWVRATAAPRGGGGGPAAAAAAPSVGDYDAAAAALRRRAYRLLLGSCAAAGPSFIKWAQWASSRRDLFPDEFIDVVGSLQDAAPTHAGAHSARAVAAAFGSPPGELFEEFSAEAVASGSIAQVHRARLRLPCGGSLPVAVKVRHPDVAARIATDFRLLGLLASAAGRVRALRGLSLRQSVAQFTATMTAQCDLRVEAAHALRFANNFAGACVCVFWGVRGER